MKLILNLEYIYLVTRVNFSLVDCEKVTYKFQYENSAI